MGLTPDDIRALLEAFEASTWQELTIDIGEDHFHVSRRANGSAPAPPPAPVDERRPPLTTGVAEARRPAEPVPAAAANGAPSAPPSPVAPATNGHGLSVTAPS